MRLDALDRSHITFVHLELKASLFDEYVCDVPEKINIDTGEFMSVLKRAKSQDRVIMSLDEGNFIITFEGDATRTFKIRLIDIEYDNPTPPELEHPASFKVHFGILKDAINDIDIFSDKIALQVDEDYFRASLMVNLVEQVSNTFMVKISTLRKNLYSHWTKLGKCLKQTNSLKKLKSV